MKLRLIIQLCSRKIVSIITLFLTCALVLLLLSSDREPDDYIDVGEVKRFSFRRQLDPYGAPNNAIPFTDFSESMALDKRHFWDAIQPGYKCPTGLINRIGGRNRDGWKWLCGMETLGSRSLQDGHNCTMYSFGVAGDSGFEASVLNTAHCSLHAYDPTVRMIGRPLKMTNPKVHFHKLGIAGVDSDGGMKTLKTLMDGNGHDFIDILKMDVEMAEYESLEGMLQDFVQLPFGQLLVEFHLGDDREGEMRKRLHRLLMNIEKRGARLFYVEKNSFYPDSCAEFSFINLNYLSLFIPDA